MFIQLGIFQTLRLIRKLIDESNMDQLLILVSQVQGYIIILPTEKIIKLNLFAIDCHTQEWIHKTYYIKLLNKLQATFLRMVTLGSFLEK